MIAIKLPALISNGGKLVPLHLELMQNWLMRYAGSEIQITLGPRKKDKTGAQLGYLFGHVLPAISDYTGYTVEEIYGLAKGKFLVRNPGTEKEYVGSLSESDCAEVSRFISDCVDWGLHIGAEIFPSEYFGGTQ